MKYSVVVFTLAMALVSCHNSRKVQDQGISIGTFAGQKIVSGSCSLWLAPELVFSDNLVPMPCSSSASLAPSKKHVSKPVLVGVVRGSNATDVSIQDTLSSSSEHSSVPSSFDMYPAWPGQLLRFLCWVGVVLFVLVLARWFLRGL